MGSLRYVDLERWLQSLSLLGQPVRDLVIRWGHVVQNETKPGPAVQALGWSQFSSVKLRKQLRDG